MDYAKMENNSFMVFNEYFDMVETIYESFHCISHQATEKNIELKALIDHPENLRFLNHFYGDKKRLGQTLANFLSNALKFSNKGGSITLDIKVQDLQDIIYDPKDDQIHQEEEFIEKYLSLQLSVIDTGIGISKEGLQKLFIDFGKLKENENQN